MNRKQSGALEIGFTQSGGYCSASENHAKSFGNECGIGHENETLPHRAFLNYSRLDRERGATAFELTVVITLFLILVGVVFIGFTAWKHAGVPQNTTTIADVAAWKDGANKAACLLNLSSIQKAVRGYQKMKKLATGDPLTVDTLTREGYWTSVPTCPAEGVYSFLSTVPAAGVAFTTCSIPGHAPSEANLDNW